VIARKLHESGKSVRVLLLADPAELRGDSAVNFEKLPVKPVLARKAEEIGSEAARAVFEGDVLIDAILGTGFRPPVTGVYAQAIERINASTAPVIAVDIPSGADADAMGSQTGAVARAEAVVTFTAPRPAHLFGDLTDGPTVVAPIGSPDQAIQSSLHLNLITAKEVAPFISPVPEIQTRECTDTCWLSEDHWGKLERLRWPEFRTSRRGRPGYGGDGDVGSRDSCRILPRADDRADGPNPRGHDCRECKFKVRYFGKGQDCVGHWTWDFAQRGDLRVCA
jgi:hydroxyethylthiazole kinase-like uncharacterized protein yjeF